MLKINSDSLPEKYYNFWINFINFKGKIKLLPVNFKHHWTDIIFRQKTYVFLAVLGQAITNTFSTLVPILMGFILKSQSYIYFSYLIIGWGIIRILEFLTVYFAATFEVQATNSIFFGAYTFFLTVDPIYHTKKATGKLFAKIERGALAYENLSSLLIFDIIPTAISLTVVIISFWTLSSYLGLFALGLLTAIAILNAVLTLLSSKAFEQKIIDADDIVKNISLETLNLIQLIRSSFASDEIEKQARQKNYQLMYKQATFWLAFSAVSMITKICYLISIFLIGITIINLIKSNTITALTATTLILTYIRGASSSIQIGRKIRIFIKSTTRIKDLFNFIKEFGEQTFPVLEKNINPDLKKIPTTLDLNTISIKAMNLYFAYNPKAQIFNDHYLDLTINKDQENKLYGVIGPSGSGKTTLISMLGGQLKPTKGQVIINGIDIYTIGDKSRRSLIAMQGQVASSLSGTLRDNLLLSLPKDGIYYSDEELREVLEKVGIWTIFQEKEGLATFVGEGGMNLSGGQRQRLNFANLYLRANFYKPLLILIDEPTSSLDPISEKSITKMIDYLAKKALTLVIAHRINTLENAQGIADFSLLSKYKEIKFYPQAKLLNLSEYYKKLIKGEIEL